ncbi:heparan-alpha-glucosaminide N-acetyltransferase domain-containing protein [Aquimarina sp. 2201CG1-2-11]|uniref:heparan-alpha-glucosaminide N-acetyltransferase domain-containing protein n=1 Tax=Aquimarina discodermiae TaxID=3231043 RepID=UPI0034632645
MTKPKDRLHFLDAIRAFAIIMMLQGHFVHALLADVYRDNSNVIYVIWEYFRGITAPTFFTITGFVFSYLLLKSKEEGVENPRVLKGIKRAVKVILWGYFLRLSLFAIFEGTVNPSFFYVDVLHCIGTSLLLLISIYLIVYQINKTYFLTTLLCLGLVIFLLEPVYSIWNLEFLPKTVANYFTSKNGSVFTLFPWFGYVCFGGFMAGLFLKHKNDPKFYKHAILSLSIVGVLLMFCSSPVLMLLHNVTGVVVFKSVAYNNFLFIRLGNVLILFSVFVLLKDFLTSKILTNIGKRTLSIYILHFFVLYGSWFGLGLNRFFYHQLNVVEIFIGALFFIISISGIVLYYYKHEKDLKSYSYTVVKGIRLKINDLISGLAALLKTNVIIRKYKAIRQTKE